MVKSFCKKEDFQPMTDLGNGMTLIKFSKEIMYDENGNDTGFINYTEDIIKGEITPEKLISIRIKEVEEYDKSDAVNEFFYLGKSMWFDKVTRATISYSMECEKKSGADTTDLYDNDNVKYTLPIDLAISMFGQLEIYAKKCYNQTAFHHNALMALDNVDDLLAYDITSGYPEKLNITAPAE